MIFTKAQKARYDKFIHKGGDHGSDGELWNRHDLHIIIHGLLKKRLTKRVPDVAKSGEGKSKISGKRPAKSPRR